MLAAVLSARDEVAAADEAALADAREKMAAAVAALLTDIGSRDAAEDERRSLDSALAPEATALKGEGVCDGCERDGDAKESSVFNKTR